MSFRAAVNAPVHNPPDNPDSVRAIHKPGKLVVSVKVTLEASESAIHVKITGFLPTVSETWPNNKAIATPTT